MDKPRIRAVLFQEEGYWVAQCLEFDLAAQARDFKDLLGELDGVVAGRVAFAKSQGLDPFACLPKAPQRYWEMFEAAAADVQPRPRTGHSLPDATRPQLELRAA